jgi:hypothetical protein
MTMGCPVVASDVGACKELVANGAGVLVPYSEDLRQQAKAFAGTVLALASKPEVREGMILAARQKASRFSHAIWQKTLISAMKRKTALFTLRRSGPPVSRKIFVIGCPKTGTSSVGAALSAMGFRDYGWDPVYQDYYHMGNHPPIWEVVGQFDTFSDGPFNTGDFYKVLFERYSDALFILTTRKKEPWKDSFVSHFGPKSQNKWVLGRYRLHNIVPEHWWEWYDRRNAEIQGFFAKRNALHRLMMFPLEYDDEAKWRKLIDFAAGGSSVFDHLAGQPFPHKNAEKK